MMERREFFLSVQNIHELTSNPHYRICIYNGKKEDEVSCTVTAAASCIVGNPRSAELL